MTAEMGPSETGEVALTGDHHYVLHFDKAGLPPVYAFWSVTMHDARG
jgi:hypothetical protein